MKEALVVMAKAPLPGQVKTRLLGALTAEDAAELYAAFLSDTFVTLEDIADEREDLALVLCYTPAAAVEAFEAVEREGSLLLQQRGDDLGARLTNCFSDLFAAGYEAVVVLGGDSPTLPGEHVWDALEALVDEATIVAGPTEDGGYAFIGMRRLHASLFDGIAWSSDTVLAQTRTRAHEAGLTLVELPAWYDVDTPEALTRLQEELRTHKEVGYYTRRCLKAIAKRAREAQP